MNIAKWERKPLGSIADLCLGKMLDQKKNRGELYPYLANLNVRWGTFNLEDLRNMRFESHEMERYGLKFGDIVLCEGGEPGRCAIWKEQISGMMFQKALHRIRPSEVLDYRFLFYGLLHIGQSKVFDQYFTGSTIKHLTLEKLAKVEINFPSLPIQDRIASVLSNYDDLIENNNRRIAILENMAQSLYKEWFVNFRFPGYENCKFVDSPMGKVPEGWSVKPLSEAIFIDRGRSYKSTELAAEGEGYPFLNLKNILREGGFRRDGLKWYSGPFKPSNVAKPNDIIMAVTDMTQERAIVARAARVPQMGFEEFVISMDLIKITAKPEYDPGFIYSFLRYSEFPHAVKAFANGANVLHLSPKVVADYMAILPDRKTSTNFSKLLSPIHSLQDSLSKKNDNLKDQRDMLLPRLVSGQIELKN